MRPGEARNEVAEFLTEGGGTRRLSMGAGGHGGIRIAVRKLRELVHTRADHGEQRATRRAQQGGVTEVVDVLGGAAEMDELECGG